MHPDDVRRFASPYLYANPFWSDPIDPAADPLCQQAAAAIAHWVPIARQRVRLAVRSYLAVWALDIAALLWANAQGEKTVGIWAAVVLAAQLFVTPWPLIAYVQGASKHPRQARAAVHGASVQRYQDWLVYLRQHDLAAYTQITLWHQGEQARQLQQAQLAVEAFNAYQLHDIRQQLRDR